MQFLPRAGFQPVAKKLLFVIGGVAAVIFLGLAIWYVLNAPVQFSPSITNLHFSDNTLQAKYHSYLTTSRTKKGKDKYSFLVKAFTLLSLDYQKEKTEDKKKVLLEFLSYFDRYFPKESENLELPCETDCERAVIYDEQLKKLWSQIEARPDIQADEKQSVKMSLDQVSLSANDANGQFSGYSGAFFILQKIYGQNKSKGIQNLAVQILERMKKIDSVAYSKFDSGGVYKLE